MTPRGKTRRDWTGLLLLLLSGMMVLVLGVIIASAFRTDPSELLDDEADGATTSADPRVVRCNPAILEQSVCPDDHFCNGSTCEPTPRVEFCKAGRGCREK